MGALAQPYYCYCVFRAAFHNDVSELRAGTPAIRSNVRCHGDLPHR